MPVGRRSSIGESKVRAGQGEDGGNQAMSDTPITDAAYLRAGRRVDDQLSEIDQTCRNLERALAQIIAAIDKHGEGRSMMHPRLSMAISNGRDAINP
jgi:hypothetical protein